MSEEPLPSSIADLLNYLRDVGFADVYRRSAYPPSSAAAGDAPRESSAHEAAPSAPVRVLEPLAVRRPRLEEAAVRAASCTACRLAAGRQSVVFGSGDPDADLMFIGEGPGAEEDKQGLPFVGRAGELLTKIIQAIECTREQVYIANIVKCRPPGNRDPEPDEVAACRGFLETQIDSIRPRVIVALGRIAAQTLLADDTPISKLRGKWYSFHGVPMMVTFHPAALLRNPALKRPTWDDMQQVQARLRALGPKPDAS